MAGHSCYGGVRVVIWWSLLESHICLTKTNLDAFDARLLLRLYIQLVTYQTSATVKPKLWLMTDKGTDTCTVLYKTLNMCLVASIIGLHDLCWGSWFQCSQQLGRCLSVTVQQHSSCWDSQISMRRGNAVHNNKYVIKLSIFNFYGQNLLMVGCG